MYSHAPGILIISRCFSTKNWFLIYPASIGDTLRNPPHYSDAQRAQFVYFWIKIPRGVEGREGRKEELTQSGNKTITRGVISWSKKDIFPFLGVIFM